MMDALDPEAALHGRLDIVICGVPRAGKSILADRLRRVCHGSVMHVDALTNLLKRRYADSFGMDWRLDGALQEDPTEPVVIGMIRNAGSEFDDLRIYDSSVLRPASIVSGLRLETTLPVCLGYPRICPRDLMRRVRTAAQSDPCCWSHGMSDAALLRHVEHFLAQSRALEAQCGRLELPFVDVSRDWRSAIEHALVWLKEQVAARRFV